MSAVTILVLNNLLGPLRNSTLSADILKHLYALKYLGQLPVQKALAHNEVNNCMHIFHNGLNHVAPLAIQTV